MELVIPRGTFNDTRISHLIHLPKEGILSYQKLLILFMVGTLVAPSASLDLLECLLISREIKITNYGESALECDTV